MGREGQDGRETARIEAFSDGVFAIAITLLILEVKVPREVEPGGLYHALLEGWPSWVGYLSSFATIGIMWMNHHRLFTLIRKADDRLLLYNGLLLLAVSIVPFPTALLAEYARTPDARVAATVYSVHGLIIAIAFTLLWRHAAGGRRLLGSSISARTADDIWRQYRFGPLFYLISIGLAQVSAMASIGFCLLLALFFAMPPEALRKHVERCD